MGKKRLEAIIINSRISDENTVLKKEIEEWKTRYNKSKNECLKLKEKFTDYANVHLSSSCIYKINNDVCPANVCSQSSTLNVAKLQSDLSKAIYKITNMTKRIEEYRIKGYGDDEDLDYLLTGE